MDWYGEFLPYAATATLGVRRQLHNAVGGFDESFVRGGRTSTTAGASNCAHTDRCISSPDAVVHYRYRSGLRALFRQARDYGASDVHAYAKWRDSVSVPSNQWSAGFWAAIRVLAEVRHVRGRGTLGRWIWQIGDLIGHVQASIHLRVPLLCSDPVLARCPFAIATRGSAARR